MGGREEDVQERASFHLSTFHGHMSLSHAQFPTKLSMVKSNLKKQVKPPSLWVLPAKSSLRYEHTTFRKPPSIFVKSISLEKNVKSLTKKKYDQTFDLLNKYNHTKYTLTPDKNLMFDNCPCSLPNTQIRL